MQDILQYLDEYLHPIVSPEHWSVYSELYDMVSMLPSAQPEWIPVTKEEMFKAGYEGREIRFRVDGRLFAIRELAQ